MYDLSRGEKDFFHRDMEGWEGAESLGRKERKKYDPRDLPFLEFITGKKPVPMFSGKFCEKAKVWNFLADSQMKKPVEWKGLGNFFVEKNFGEIFNQI